MDRGKRQAIIEWGIAILLIFLVINKSPYFSYYHLSPVKAFEQSERTFYYGPSEVLEKVDLGDVQVFLSTYKDWFSATLVKKHAGIFWGPGSGVGGLEKKANQDITHSWGGSSIDKGFMLMRYYGIVSNPGISSIELDVTEGYGWDDAVPDEDITTLVYDLKDHPMFLFHWNAEEHDYLSLEIRGVNSSGGVIYEEDLR